MYAKGLKHRFIFSFNFAYGEKVMKRREIK